MQRLNLSIDTDLDQRSNASLTDTTKISITPFSTTQSLDSTKTREQSSNSEIQNIIKINDKVCKAVRKRIDEQKEARNQMEIMELRKQIVNLKETVDTLQREYVKNDKDVNDSYETIIKSCPSVPKHNILELKVKVKAAKKKNKHLSTESNEHSYEDARVDTIFTDMTSHSIQDICSCNIF